KQEIDGAKVAIFGLTFKENVGDVRNTRVIDIIDELKEYGVNVIVYDPVAEVENVYREFGIELASKDELQDLDSIVMAVPHNELKEEFDLDRLETLFKNDRKVLVDIKSIYDRKECERRGFHYWSL